MENKYKEALDNVMKDNPKAKLTISDIHKDIRLLLELVLKETPKKPLDDEPIIKIISGKEVRFISWYKFCPSCKKILNPNPNWCEKHNYCPECSQKLDWSDE